VVLSEQEFYEFWTQAGKGIEDFVEEREMDVDPEMIREYKRGIFHLTLKEELKMYDGVYDTITELSKTYPLALVTGSFKKDVDVILDLTKLRKFFNFILPKDSVKKGKPDPEGFLTAAKELELALEPENILVIEDAEKGVVAAHKAGMKIIAIPNKYTQNNDFSLADKVIASIKELTPEFINTL